MALSALALALALAYPFLVYAGLRLVSAPVLLSLLVLLVALRIAFGRRIAGAEPFLIAPFCALLALLPIAPFDGELALRAYPFLLSLALGLLFAWSLRGPASAIEKIARMTEPDLPPAAIAYTRKVTMAWTAFFLGNAAIAGATALAGDMEIWALYNGLVSYLIAGTLMAVEYGLRQRMRRRIGRKPAPC